MEGHREAGLVRVGGDARQRLHDARGYGRPDERNEILLAPVEAAHLLFRGDLEAVDGDAFRAYLEGQPEAVGASFLAYADLRERGYYLAPAREGWVDAPRTDADFAVFPRGNKRGENGVAYWVRVVGERESIPAASLGDLVLAVVDEEGEVSYLETRRPDLAGQRREEPPALQGSLLGDRVVAWDPPPALYASCFYGQPLAGRAGDPEGPVQLSLVEAAHLASSGRLDIEGGPAAVRERGRAVEGDRFDRRLAATFLVARLFDETMVPVGPRGQYLVFSLL
jgi:tRNA-intron endonuclease